MNYRTYKFPVVLLSAGVVLACQDGGEEAELQVRGENGEISTTIPNVSFERVATVGGIDAPESDILLTVLEVDEDDDGNGYILNHGLKQLVVVDGEGEHLRVIGGEGQGPGEFVSPGSMAISDPYIYVLDPPSFRISRFALSNGDFVDNIPLNEEFGFPRKVRSGNDDLVYVEFQPIPGTTANSTPAIARLSMEAESVAPIVRFEPVPRIEVTELVQGRRITRFIDAPYAPKLVWDVAPDGSILFGDGHEYEVFRADGREVGTVFRLDRRAEPVEQEDIRSFFERNEALSQSESGVEFPDTKPFFSDLRAGRDSLVWIRLPNEAFGQHRWEVRSLSGDEKGGVILPRRARLAGVSSNALYLVQIDAHDIESVVKLSMVWSS